MDLSIIIVNYNGKQDLLRCLGSLAAVGDEVACEVVVVDNGSTDGSVEAVRAAHPAVAVQDTGKNLGFAGGCNVGLALARGRHVLLLNPDTEVRPTALSLLVKALDDHPAWGIVGPMMVNPADRPYGAARRFPTPYFLFCESTRLLYIFPHCRFFSRYVYGERDLMTLDAVDQVEGSALMISGRARQSVGPMDERFFLFFEEVDWCKRVKDAGYEIHIVPAATIRHHGATTMSRFYRQSRVANARSAMNYFAKHHGEQGLRSLRRWMRCALTLRVMIVRLMLVFGPSEKLRMKLEGALAERLEYAQGIQP